MVGFFEGMAFVPIVDCSGATWSLARSFNGWGLEGLFFLSRVVNPHGRYLGFAESNLSKIHVECDT